MSAYLALLRRDLRLAFRSGGEWVNPLVFFLMVIALFPLGVSPEPSTLKVMAGGVVWVAVLLAVLLSMDGLFRQDFEDGSLEQMLVCPASLLSLVMAKITAHWLTTGLVLTLLSPLAAMMLYLDERATGVLVMTLLLGTPTLSLIAAVAAALTVALRRAGILIPLISLPLMIPVLIFATGAVQAAALGLPVGAYLALLGAFLVLAITLIPFAIAGALKLSAGG